MASLFRSTSCGPYTVAITCVLPAQQKQQASRSANGQQNLREDVGHLAGRVRFRLPLRRCRVCTRWPALLRRAARRSAGRPSLRLLLCVLCLLFCVCCCFVFAVLSLCAKNSIKPNISFSFTKKSLHRLLRRAHYWLALVGALFVLERTAPSVFFFIVIFICAIFGVTSDARIRFRT